MPISYHQLTYEERCQIETLKKRGDSIQRISKELGLHRSTVYRELDRNTGLKGYRYKQAHGSASQRRQNVSSRPKKMEEKTIAYIKDNLLLQWSPEQIAGRMKLEKDLKCVSYETIYRFVWKDKHSGGVLYKQLRRCGKKYNRRGSKKAGRGCIPNRIDIKERSAIVEAKERIGDFELDTIQGAGHKGSIVSIVDRASKLTMLVKLPHAYSKDVSEAIIGRLYPIKNFVHTLTSDNGKEFSGHEDVSTTLGVNFYFATPYHSWERGLNEHTNGLVRQYFPKGNSFDNITQKDVLAVEELLNNRPRKILGYRTPAEVFQQKSMCYTEDAGHLP